MHRIEEVCQREEGDFDGGGEVCGKIEEQSYTIFQ